MMRNRSNKKKMKEEERRQRYHSSRSQKNTRTKERVRENGRGRGRGGMDSKGKESRARTQTQMEMLCGGARYDESKKTSAVFSLAPSPLALAIPRLSDSHRCRGRPPHNICACCMPHVVFLE